MYRRTRAGTHHEKTGESSTDKQQCDKCGRWFVNLSGHRKCNGRTASHAAVLNAPQPDASSTSRRHSQIGTTRKDVLKQKSLQPRDKILQVCDILITATVIKIYNWLHSVRQPKRKLCVQWINKYCKNWLGWLKWHDSVIRPICYYVTHSLCDKSSIWIVFKYYLIFKYCLRKYGGDSMSKWSISQFSKFQGFVIMTLATLHFLLDGRTEWQTDKFSPIY